MFDWDAAPWQAAATGGVGAAFSVIKDFAAVQIGT